MGGADKTYLLSASRASCPPAARGLSARTAPRCASEPAVPYSVLLLALLFFVFGAGRVTMKRTTDAIEDAPRTINVHTLTTLPSTFSSTQMGSEGNISHVSQVVREQYCLCRPRTALERRLVLVVGALALLVVGLLVGLILALARHNPDVVELKNFLSIAHLKWFRV